MNGKRNFKILIFIFVSVLFLSIAYASISNITLTIGGTATAEAEATLDVKFSSDPADIETSSSCLTDSNTVTDCATITASVTGDRTATFDISGLKGYGDVAIVRYKILNESTNIDALLDITATTNSNTEYFLVTTDLSNAASQTVAAGGYTILTVRAKVNKVLTASSTQTATITITVNASAV